MIAKFVQRFEENKDDLRANLSKKHPESYFDVVQAVVRILSDEESWDSPDPTRIHLIDDGDYQGTLVFVIGSKGYQPSNYWSVLVSYGSCSGCDTLQSISGYSDDPPTQYQVDDYMTLAMHVVQKLRPMQEDWNDVV